MNVLISRETPDYFLSQKNCPNSLRGPTGVESTVDGDAPGHQLVANQRHSSSDISCDQSQSNPFRSFDFSLWQTLLLVHPGRSPQNPLGPSQMVDGSSLPAPANLPVFQDAGSSKVDPVSKYWHQGEIVGNQVRFIERVHKGERESSPRTIVLEGTDPEDTEAPSANELSSRMETRRRLREPKEAAQLLQTGTKQDQLDPQEPPQDKRSAGSALFQHLPQSVGSF